MTIGERAAYAVTKRARWQVITLWYSLFAWSGEPLAYDPRSWYLPSATDPLSK